MHQKEPHIQDYIQVIMRRRWVILTFFTVLVVTVLIGSLKQTPIYESTTTLLIERKSPHVVSVQEVTPMGTTGDYRAYRDYYETQYKLIKSSTLIRKVASSLGLKPNNPHKGDNPVKKLLKAIKVKPVKNSQLVEISAESPEPETAAIIANTVADEYIKENLKRSITTASNAAEWLSKKIEDQRQKLIDSEINLQKFREEHNISILPLMTSTSASEDVKVEYARLHALLANYTQRYTDEHPKVIELKAQIDSLKSKIQGLEDIKMGNKTMEYRVLEREVQTNKRMYDILLGRLKEIDVSSTLNVNNISIIDRAEVPEEPIKPNLKLNMMLAVMVGLVMGTGLGFFVDYLDTTVKSPQDVKEILESHFLGSIPEIAEQDELKKDKIVHFKPKSPVSEAYRDIRTEILNLTQTDDSAKTILITSAEPQAGKTITTANLGIVLSQKGNQVLLVDSDLRKPQLHRIFGLDRKYGLSEYLRGNAALDSIIKHTKIENLKVITSGKMPSDPAEIISSEKMEKFIHNVKQKFDFVLFDSPPVASVTDAVILASMVGTLIQVVRSGKLLVPIALRTKEKLINTKTKILGVVLNDLKTYHDDYYYYKYYRYYGEEGKKRKSATKDLSWQLKEKFPELRKQLSETWSSLKSDSKKMTLLVKDRLNTLRLRAADRWYKRKPEEKGKSESRKPKAEG